MSNVEEFANMAKRNEELAAKEVQEVLKKYGVSIHHQAQYVDGQLAGGGIFFKFRPDAFLNPQNQG